MKKNEPKQAAIQSATKDQAYQFTQDNPTQDDLSLEELDQVSGGSITRLTDKSSPNLFRNSFVGTPYQEK